MSKFALCFLNLMLSVFKALDLQIGNIEEEQPEQPPVEG
jgi:hypothetical protein